MSTHVLAGDVGATKTNLALYSVAGPGQLSLVREASFPSRRYRALEDIVQAFLPPGGERVAAGVFGIAGPVSGNVILPTNLPWEAVDAARLAPQIPCERVRLMNDLATMAYGALFLPASEIYTLNRGKPRPGHRAVIAAGTGLGQAILFWDGARHCPLSTEGGHADFAPRNRMELELAQFLLDEFGRVSCERVLSGPGLLNILRFLDVGLRKPVEPAVRQRMQTEDPSAVVGQAGVAGTCRTCAEVVDMFVSIYGAQAGNIALTVMAVGGVYVGGGIAPKMLSKMTTGAFMDAFTAKQPFADLMADIPVYVILNPRTPQLGAAHAAAELAQE